MPQFIICYMNRLTIVPDKVQVLVATCIKFREYSLSGFQVIEQTQFL